ncbi:hypothetical protein NFA_16330 [Nocardia farcinica IFM 10152]|uniref:Uncharacterized protein n=1 Tax=Nocardia farcinica (strain IFM 10152) TaxID=247156 RepID=Q5YZB2_NOCFA|nr:hypothetical protein NFA_16330 [Nocardia farcinica IFM 10152]
MTATRCEARAVPGGLRPAPATRRSTVHIDAPVRSVSRMRDWIGSDGVTDREA